MRYENLLSGEQIDDIIVINTKKEKERELR